MVHDIFSRSHGSDSFIYQVGCGGSTKCSRGLIVKIVLMNNMGCRGPTRFSRGLMVKTVS